MKLVSADTILLLGEQYDLQTTCVTSVPVMFLATRPMMTDVQEL
jgi:hypothetical protein